MAFDAILFDCDGVLVDSEIIYGAVEQLFLSRLGLTYDHATYRTRFTGLDPRAYVREVQAIYAREIGTPFPDGFFDDMNTEIEARLDTDLQAIPGIDRLLAGLNGKTKAVASSSQLDRLHRKLAKTKLARHFGSHVYSGEQVAMGKPAPDLFLFAARQLGVGPSNCLVIEDSANGVKAGVSAGMTVWGFTGGGHSHARHETDLLEAGAAQVFPSHETIAAALRQH
ncbi:HAD superfamily hydrolase (TIGR01509 family) [Roseibium hamelinense]|uniref:HAD superfamily hydrolase (TIGR01509 family) n=1 Tax=Roseibium hamelinense TaxID=150831 RepID=A0A562SLN0_9HYPH|nr:HAD family hydrolase [Roseibium hamelinense]MTI43407.1 HAD family hydrolase [Roseibium hamelinense]TWI81864.1 HAD superfamily hydrolase (TIGR01509 family) [Roseibium hamelinense]